MSKGTDRILRAAVSVIRPHDGVFDLDIDEAVAAIQEGTCTELDCREAGWGAGEAARLANYAGSLVVMKRGTATVSAAELLSACAARGLGYHVGEHGLRNFDLPVRRGVDKRFDLRGD